MKQGKPMVLGYLCSEFPALSHTFISREIAVLRKEGFRIVTASINAARDVGKMGKEDQEFARTTYCVKTTPLLRIAALLFRYMFRPKPFCSALALSAGLAWRSGPRDLGKAIGYFVEALLVHDWARRNEVTHVHVHFANAAATVALIATRFGSLEYSMSVHGPDEFYDVQRNNLREKIIASAFVRCISFYCRSQLMRLSPVDQWNKLHIVRCGIFNDEFRWRAGRPAITRNILCVGRLCPSKGQAILVEAAGILASRGLDFHILFLGGGEDLEAMISMVERKGLAARIAMAGAVGHERVTEELAACDLFVLPSFAEGVPVALMEAMASGIPVVTTGITGIPELVEHGIDGILVQPSNSSQLADALEPFLRGRIDVASMTAKAAEKVRAEYDVETNTRKLGELFLALAQ